MLEYSRFSDDANEVFCSHPGKADRCKIWSDDSPLPAPMP